jgi:hypothetical protein
MPRFEESGLQPEQLGWRKCCRAKASGDACALHGTLIKSEADLDPPMSHIGLRVLLLLDSSGASRDKFGLDIRPDETMKLSRQRGGRYADHVGNACIGVVGMFLLQQR